MNDESIGEVIIAVRISSRDLCDDGNDVEHDMTTTMFFPPSCHPATIFVTGRHDMRCNYNRRGF